MGRIFLVILLVGLLGIAAAVFGLGMFPPDPKVQQIQKVIPNDRFGRPG